MRVPTRLLPVNKHPATLQPKPEQKETVPKMSFRDWKIVRVLAGIAMRIWAASGAALLSAFLIYVVYGGFFAFLLLLFAVSGKRGPPFFRTHQQVLTIDHLLLQAFCTTRRTTCCTIRSCRPTRASSYPFPPCTGCLTKRCT